MDGQTVFRGRVLDNGEPASLGVIQELERRTRIQAPADAATWPLSSVKLFFCSGGAVRPRPSKQAAAQFPGNLDKAIEESDEQDGRTEKMFLSEATEYVGEPLPEFESGMPGAVSLDAEWDE